MKLKDFENNIFGGIYMKEELRPALIKESKRLIDIPKTWIDDKNIQALPKRAKENLIQQIRGVIDWIIDFASITEAELE